MTSHGRYAAPEPSFAQSSGNAAARGLVLIAIAVVIGFLLLWQGGVGGSGSSAAVQGGDTGADTDDASGDQTDVGDDGTDAEDGDDAPTDDGTGEETATGDDAVTDDTTPPPSTTRPLGEVKVAVANGVGESGLAGARSQVLSTAGYVSLAVNAAANTELSAVYYVDGYGLEASGVAVELGATDAVLRPATDPGALVADPAAVEGFHIFVVLGSDRVLG